MKQIIALVSDGKVKYALVDDGSITEFAQVLVPDRFGITEAAALGLNLADAVGLSGPRAKLRPAPQELAAEIEQAVTAKRKPGPQPGRSGAHVPRGTRTKAGYRAGGRFVSLEEVVEVVNAHPKGISIPDTARELVRDGDEYQWIRTSVNNRLTAARESAKHGKPMPVRISQTISSSTGKPGPLLMPLASVIQGGVQS